jgi:regulator of ribosome biosynthesis
MGSDAKKMRKDPQEEVINVRKAIRHATKGQGASALANKTDGKRRKGKR